jgi:hypothetical protein
MTAEIANILAGVISGVIGGGLAILGALLAVRKGVRDLEENEIRQQRVTCIANLYGLRFALSPELSARPEDQARFMFEINRAGALFADDPEILNGIRDFHDAVRSKKDPTEATNRFITLIRKMGQQTRLHVQTLSDADVKSTFLLPVSNTVVQFIPVAVQPVTGMPAQAGEVPPPSKTVPAG